VATTLKTASLVTKITEKLTLNGKDFGNTTTKTISGIKDCSQRIIRVLSAANGTQLYAGGAAVGPGTFISANVQYIRVTNLDASNYVILHLEGSSHYAQLKLEAGKSFLLPTPVGFDNNADMDSFSSETITKIEALANTANVDVEVFVASK
jgi:hypothetical protein